MRTSAANVRRWLGGAALTILLASCGLSSGNETFPEFTAPVVDAADAVSQDVETALNAELEQFRTAGGPQIAVAVVDTTGSASLEDYSIDLARDWGVGAAEQDDGVVIVVALDDRRMRIEVGSGVEGDLTDITAAQIVDTVMIPLLRENAVDEAVAQGARAVMGVWRGDTIPAPTVPQVANEASDGASIADIVWFVLFFFMVVIVPIFMRATGRGRGRVFGPPIIIPGGFGGSFGGGFGGGSFGGFGGGGGGGFSGGGASGSW